MSHGQKTFEPTEDLEAAKAQAGQAEQSRQAEQAAPAAAKPKGPSPEQLLAIKAAIANAAVRACMHMTCSVCLYVCFDWCMCKYVLPA